MNRVCEILGITKPVIQAHIHLSGPDFLKRKNNIIRALEHEIEHGDMDRLAAIRQNKRSL